MPRSFRMCWKPKPAGSVWLLVVVIFIVGFVACGSSQHSNPASPPPAGTGPSVGGSSPTTTTLQAETGNNTSAADSFSGGTNGNSRPGNVSKVPITALLYSGANTKIYAHYMP